MENESNQLSEAEINALLQAAKIRRAASSQRPEDINKRQEVSKDEYVRRLEAARKKDLNVLGHLREDKIAKATSEWAEKVGATFAHAHTEIPQILERVERMQTKQGLHKTSILFHGDELGRGKTWAAYSYLNSLVQLGVILPGQIFFGTESSTLSKASNSGFERSEELREMKRDSHKVFFIDDVGQGYYFKQEHRHEVWYELIDHVYTRRLTLVLTTNLGFNDKSLGAWIGRRAFDRLRTLVGNDGVILLTGVNRRDDVFIANEENYRKKSKN